MSALDKTATVGVVGAGAMGQGIAQVAVVAGHPVLLFDIDSAAAEKALTTVRGRLDRLVEKERMRAADRDAAAARLAVAPTLEAMAPAKLVVEAVVERLDVKQQVFKTLEAACDDDVILASNTSSLSITAVASALERPERMAGMHFFNPAPLMRLVEIISGLATDKDVATTLYDTAAVWGKAPVYAKSTPGFIVNRVARPFYAEALRLLKEGAGDAATIDAVLRDCGEFRMGPLQLTDLIGQDVNAAVTRSVFDAYNGDPRFEPSLVQEELVAAGRLGRKSGRGFYDYGEGADKPAAQEAAPHPAPGEVVLVGDLGPAASLATMIEQSDIATTRRAGENGGDGYIALPGGAHLMLTDGALATAKAVETGAPVILFDLARDYTRSPRLVLAPSDGCPAEALDAAVGLVQALGKQATVIDDAPGLVVMRTVAMLANEAADAVHQRVAGAADVDTAMEKGVNYPLGPLAWADAIGTGRVLAVLDNMAAVYGDGRYRPSPLLRRKALTADRFAGDRS